MANVSVYNMEGKEVGTLELNDAVFGVEVNEMCIRDRRLERMASAWEYPSGGMVIPLTF